MIDLQNQVAKVPLSSLWHSIDRKELSSQVGKEIDQKQFDMFLEMCFDDWTTEITDRATEMWNENESEIIFNTEELNYG